jgi:acetylornithine deacetylase/succinyl-diaminopimelate desuccinylase-like protein
VNGKGAHASRPWEAENAIHKSIALDEHLRTVFPLPSKNEWKTTVVLTKIETENGVNQIPEKAKALFDIRYVSKKESTDVLKEVRKFLGKTTPIKIIAENNMFKIKETNAYVEALSKVIKEVHGKKASFLYTNGTSDAVFFSEKNIPVLLFQPKGGGEHESGEWVDMNSVYALYDVIFGFLRTVK